MLFGLIASLPLLLEDFALLDDVASELEDLACELELDLTLELDLACELEESIFLLLEEAMLLEDFSWTLELELAGVLELDLA